MKTRFRFLVPALALLLAVPALARGPGKQGPVDPELREARRELMAARLVTQLDLTAEQKQALKQVIEQARAARDSRQNAPETVALREDLKKATQQATAEVRKSGAVSEATQTRIDTIQKNLQAGRLSHRGEGQQFMQAALDILTPEQQQAMRQLAMEHRAAGRGGKGMLRRGQGPGAGRGMGPGMQAGEGGPGAFQPGARMGHGRRGGHRGGAAMGLLLSDELYAELGR